MSEENKQNQTPQEDPLKNLKAEMDRKFGNITNEMTKQNQALLQQLNQMTQAMAPKQAPQQAEESDDFYDMRPSKFKKEVVNEVKEAVKEMTQIERRFEAAKAQKFAQLQREYPELADDNSDMFKKLIEKHNELADHLKETPEGYELAVMRAANETGLTPRSRRPQTDDDFSFGPSNNRRNDRRTKKDRLDPITESFAEALGLNVASKEVKDRLLKRQEEMIEKEEKKRRF